MKITKLYSLIKEYENKIKEMKDRIHIYQGQIESAKLDIEEYTTILNILTFKEE